MVVYILQRKGDNGGKDLPGDVHAANLFIGLIFAMLDCKSPASAVVSCDNKYDQVLQRKLQEIHCQ